MLSWLTTLVDGDPRPNSDRTRPSPNATETPGRDSRSKGPEATERPSSIDELLAQDHVSRSDIAIVTGLEPATFLLEVVRREGGRVHQCDLVETTGWPGSTVSRYLGQLEADDAIERIQLGRKKLVHLPDAAPPSHEGE